MSFYDIFTLTKKSRAWIAHGLKGQKIVFLSRDREKRVLTIEKDIFTYFLGKKMDQPKLFITQTGVQEVLISKWKYKNRDNLRIYTRNRIHKPFFTAIRRWTITDTKLNIQKIDDSHFLRLLQYFMRFDLVANLPYNKRHTKHFTFLGTGLNLIMVRSMVIFFLFWIWG